MNKNSYLVMKMKQQKLLNINEKEEKNTEQYCKPTYTKITDQ